jgi:hypothetical protein
MAILMPRLNVTGWSKPALGFWRYIAATNRALAFLLTAEREKLRNERLSHWRGYGRAYLAHTIAG